MKILHRYILGQYLRNLGLSLLIFIFLFLIFDFFDRIDNIVSAESYTFSGVVIYFLYKIPLMLNNVLPIAMLISTMLTLGLLSKNSEVTAMRASGMTILWICKPIILVGAAVIVISIVNGETLVPYTQRRVREIYNLDIRQKHLTGTYSQSDFWWREGGSFFSARAFDSRTNILHGFSRFDVDDRMNVVKRMDAEKVIYIDSLLGWNMQKVLEYEFDQTRAPRETKLKSLPLPIREKPEDFYDTKVEADTMSFTQLRRFMKKLSSHGLPTTSYLADLYEKFASPFFNLIAALVAIPFAMKTARSGNMAGSFVAGVIIGFSYYAIHSFSISMGRAEFWHPLLAANAANIVMLMVAAILHWGAESPG